MHVHKLDDRIGDFATLTSDDAFIDALTTATQIAVRTSHADKLALLCNTVINSVLPDAPAPDTQQLFFDMIDRLIPTHVRLLHRLSDPSAWRARHDMARPNITRGPRPGSSTPARRVELFLRTSLEQFATGHPVPHYLPIPVGDRTRDRGHGRRETRTVKAVTLATPGGIAFPHAQQAVRVTRTRIAQVQPAGRPPT